MNGASLGKRVFIAVFYLQVVKDEEERFCGEPLVELHSVGVGGWDLVVERQGGAGVPHQVLPVNQTHADVSDHANTETDPLAK